MRPPDRSLSLLTPPIFFLIPPPLWPDDLPTRADQNWPGYGAGIYAWSVQTCLWLQEAGIPCELTAQIPAAGIVLCHSNILRSTGLQPTPHRLVICMKAEAPLSPKATLHIVQNPKELSPTTNRYYIPHWPQPQLIPRDAARGDRFDKLAFFGHEASLAPELRSEAWQAALAERNLSMRTIANRNRWSEYNAVDVGWNDYRDIDAVVAVRTFNPLRRWLSDDFSSKPATKLYNAWLSGTIAILGAESAYRQTGQPGKNYVEVTSFKDLLAAVDRLRGDPRQRQQLRSQGQIKAAEYTPAQIVRKWQVFFEAVAFPAYAEWRRYSPWQRRQALLEARAASYLDRLNRRWRRPLLGAVPS